MYRVIGQVISEKYTHVVFAYNLSDYMCFPECKGIPFEYHKAVAIGIALSKRSLKKMKRDKDVESSPYEIIGDTFNMKIMRGIQRVIKDYLDKNKPRYLAISAYPDKKYYQRVRIYLNMLNTMHYWSIKRYGWNKQIYILEREFKESA